MTLVRRNNNFVPSFPTFFNSFFNDELKDWNNQNYSNTDTTIPSVNVKEDDNRYEIEVAAPGLNKEDFSLKIENNVLTISSEKENEKDEKAGNYSRREFSYQSFKRSFTLPEGHILTDKILAKYNNGILRIELPKRDEVKPQPEKMIEIS